MSDAPTPETDAEKINKRDTYLLPETSEWIVTAEFAEKLELQRDSALEELARVRKELVYANRGAETNAKVNQGLCSRLAEAERERDSAWEELAAVAQRLSLWEGAVMQMKKQLSFALPFRTGEAK